MEEVVLIYEASQDFEDDGVEAASEFDEDVVNLNRLPVFGGQADVEDLVAVVAIAAPVDSTSKEWDIKQLGWLVDVSFLVTFGVGCYPRVPDSLDMLDVFEHDVRVEEAKNDPTLTVVDTALLVETMSVIMLEFAEFQFVDELSRSLWGYSVLLKSLNSNHSSLRLLWSLISDS
jgi:hypothetical protein